VDVKLRPKSFEVLRVLLEQHGQLVTKDELLNTVWVMRSLRMDLLGSA
jgi:adenylate cyclase